MSLIPLPPRDQESLAALLAKTGMDELEILQLAIQGTLRYYRLHGTVTFLTEDTHACHGCRFLERYAQEHYQQRSEGNIIPFNRNDTA